MPREKREAKVGLEEASPVNLEAFEGKVVVDERLRSTLTEAEENCMVFLTPLAAMSDLSSLPKSLLPASLELLIPVKARVSYMGRARLNPNIAQITKRFFIQPWGLFQNITIISFS